MLMLYSFIFFASSLLVLCFFNLLCKIIRDFLFKTRQVRGPLINNLPVHQQTRCTS